MVKVDSKIISKLAMLRDNQDLLNSMKVMSINKTRVRPITKKEIAKNIKMVIDGNRR